MRITVVQGADIFVGPDAGAARGPARVLKITGHSGIHGITDP
jgi:hypothetical protein